MDRRRFMVVLGGMGLAFTQATMVGRLLEHNDHPLSPCMTHMGMEEAERIALEWENKWGGPNMKRERAWRWAPLNLRSYQTGSVDAFRYLSSLDCDEVYFGLAELPAELAEVLSGWPTCSLSFHLQSISAEAARRLGNAQLNHCVAIDGLQVLTANASRGLVAATGESARLYLSGTMEITEQVAAELALQGHELDLSLHGCPLSVEAARRLSFHRGYRLDIVSPAPLPAEVRRALCTNPQKVLNYWQDEFAWDSTYWHAFLGDRAFYDTDERIPGKGRIG